MLKLRKLLLGIVLTGLSLNPIFAAAMTSMIDVDGHHAAHLADSRAAPLQHQHCHQQSAEHPAQAPSCCKTGQCECNHVSVIQVCLLPAAFTYAVASLVWRIHASLPPLTTTQFFRPPIA